MSNASHTKQQRSFSRRDILASGVAPAVLGLAGCARQRKQPNILFAISDDQSFPHVSVTGDPVVMTPAFDRIAEQGVLFTNAISASPGCAPSRASILTGRGPWQLGEAGTHASYFPTELQVYPDLLEAAGYHAGFTGKGAGPANFRGWAHNPAGRPYQEREFNDTPEGIRKTDYAANFADFLTKREDGRPFCFWYGGSEPHRSFQEGVGLDSGKRLQDVIVPPLPDCDVVRSDILDYYVEIEWFDTQLGKMLSLLEEAGELDNTLVVATSDNGMAFPRAKATMYEYGIHLPLAVSWPSEFGGGRRIDDLISFMDFAPTFLEAAGVTVPEAVTGESFLDVLRSGKSGIVDPGRSSALSFRERHSHARSDNLGYPARALRTHEYLYIRNLAPERYPAGDPYGYYDIDGSPSKKYLVAHRDEPGVRDLFEATFEKSPAEQLFDIRKDPGCLANLADNSEHAVVMATLRQELEDTLRSEGDPRFSGNGDVWESYPRFNTMRPKLGGFAEEGEYNPAYQKK